MFVVVAMLLMRSVHVYFFGKNTNYMVNFYINVNLL